MPPMAGGRRTLAHSPRCVLHYQALRANDAWIDPHLPVLSDGTSILRALWQE
jgi:hypothetical protein